MGAYSDLVMRHTGSLKRSSHKSPACSTTPFRFQSACMKAGWCLVPLSKNKGMDQAELKDIRPIVVRSHVAKILEKAIMAKVAALAPNLLQTRFYQTGFKEGTPTATHVSRFLNQIHPGQGKKRRNYAALIDLQKAYDTVDREKLW